MVKVVAITGASGHFGRVLLPLLQEDPEFEQIICIDLVPPPLEMAKFSSLPWKQSSIESNVIILCVHYGSKNWGLRETSRKIFGN